MSVIDKLTVLAGALGIGVLWLSGIASFVVHGSLAVLILWMPSRIYAPNNELGPLYAIGSAAVSALSYLFLRALANLSKAMKGLKRPKKEPSE